MRSTIIIFIPLFSGLSGFSSGRIKPVKSDYAEKINLIVYQLSCDPNDRQAAKRLRKTYSEALIEYQREIDQLQLGADSFKWNNTYVLMNELNELSNEILFNSVASRIICEPKVYTHELADVKQKAILESYDAGIQSLKNASKAKAKEAYFYFVRASQLSPDFRNVTQKIQEARRKATLNVVVEKVPAYAYGKSLFSDKFYQAFLDKLKSDFLYDIFINIYSYTDVKQRRIEPVDWQVQISFFDFQIENTTTFDNSLFINISGVAEMKIFSKIGSKDIINTRFPGQYIWDKYQSRNGGDLQGLFDSFSLSMIDPIYYVLYEHINQPNY